MLARAAALVVLVRAELDEQSPGFKVLCTAGAMLQGFVHVCSIFHMNKEGYLKE